MTDHLYEARLVRNLLAKRAPLHITDKDGTTVVVSLPTFDWLVGRVEELERRFPTVWAVRYGNYDPSEVIALYDNEQAARQHAEGSNDPLEVEEMAVRSTPPQCHDNPEGDQ